MFLGVKSFRLHELKLFITIASIAMAVLLSPQNSYANSKYAAFVYDVNAGKVLFARNADTYRYPASLTKMMTLYMVFDAIDAGKLTLSTRMKVSHRAASMPPSKLYLKKGSSIRVKDAILALVTKSANDVAVVIAEHIGGTEANFAQMMTRKARSIGMTRTTFANASGLPNNKQRSTARDMARLGLSLRESHPKSFRYFETRSFQYAGRTYRNHNRLLGRVGGVNGIKTGYIRAAGFNLVTNVEKDDRHLVAVVLGGTTGRARDAHMATLIQRHMKKASTKNRRKKTNPLLVKGKSVPITVAAITPPLPTIRPQTKTLLAAATPAPKVPAVTQSAVPVAPVTSVAPVIVAANIESDSSADNLATKPAAKPNEAATKKVGWKIQLSATPNLNAAKEMLAEAYAEGAPVLSTKTPYTETVKKGSSTLYRVRFAGFEDQGTARRACNFMKTKNYNCIYLN